MSEEPAWVSSEREQFTSFRDKNKDGFMDEEEVSQEESYSILGQELRVFING